MSYLIKPEMFANKMNILIYGEPGAGKTFLAGSAQDHPGMADVHVFNIDGGIMTLAERGDIHATDIKSVDALEQELLKIAAKDKKYEKTKTVVIDNVTELQTLNIEDIVRGDLKNRIKQGGTIDDVWQEDYGKSTKQLARVLRGFRDLPIHVIYTAHKRDKYRKGTSILEESKPAITDKLCTAVMGYMDFVWYLYVADKEVANGDGFKVEQHRYLLTQPVNNYHAKTRGTAFPIRLGQVVEDPDMAQIFDLYLNNK